MEDAQIIRLFFERSEEAVDRVKEKYGRACMQLLRNLLQNDLDAEECANDVYLALWNTIPPESPEPLLTYLLKIARNQALRRLTYNNAQRRGGQTLALDELEECIADGHSVEQIVGRKLLQEKIAEFLRTLRKEDRQLFVLRYWYGESLERLEEIFGWSNSKIKSKLFRVRNRLREELIREGYL